MVCAPVRSIIPSLKLGDYLSVQAHKPCSISHLDYVQFSLTTYSHFATGNLYISPFLNLLTNSLELHVALNVHNFIARYRYLSFIKVVISGKYKNLNKITKI